MQPHQKRSRYPHGRGAIIFSGRPVLQCLARRLGVLLVFHLTIMNVYLDTLALLHIIWQDIKDQMARLAVVASRVKQPQKSTLIVQRPLRALRGWI